MLYAGHVRSALVARMLRNLRSPCKERDDNRRSLVEAQRTGRAATVKIGPVDISVAATGSRAGTPRGRTDDRVRPRNMYG